MGKLSKREKPFEPHFGVEKFFDDGLDNVSSYTPQSYNHRCFSKKIPDPYDLH